MGGSRTRRWAAVAAVTTVLTGGLAAFGGMAASAQSSSGGTCTKPTGAPVKIGIISSDAGALGNNADTSTTSKRWAAYVNAHGGLNCHPVEIIYRDDAGDAAKASQAFLELKDAGVVVIGNNSTASAAFAPDADKAKIPVVGMSATPGSPLFESDPNFFPPMTTTSGSFWGLLYGGVLAGKTKLAVMYCSEVPGCASTVEAFKKLGSQVGVTVAYSGAFGASDPNYTAQCLAAKQTGANNLLVGATNVTSALRLIDNCEQQGYTPYITLLGATAGPEALQDKNIKNAIGSSTTIPWFVKSKATATFNKVMKGYKAQIASYPIWTWTALQAIAEAAKNVSATPTTNEIYQGLYAFKDNTLGGLTAPLTYVEGQPHSVPCLFYFKLSNGKLSTPWGTKAQCRKDAASSATTTTTK